MTLLLLFIYGLATFRLAVLFSQDSGPWDVFKKLRAWLKYESKTNTPLRKSKLQTGIQCLRCSSLELAMPVAIYAVLRQLLPGWFNAGADAVLLALALSALAILLNRMLPQR